MRAAAVLTRRRTRHHAVRKSSKGALSGMADLVAWYDANADVVAARYEAAKAEDIHNWLSDSTSLVAGRYPRRWGW